MAKMRVYELARELGIESKQLVTRVKNAGFKISSHQSSLTAEDAERVRDLVKSGAATMPPASKAAEEPVIPKKSTVVRRRRKVVNTTDDGVETAVSETVLVGKDGPVVKRKVADIEPAKVANSEQQPIDSAAAQEPTEGKVTEVSEPISTDSTEAKKPEVAAKSEEAVDDAKNTTKSKEPAAAAARPREREKSAKIVRRATPEERSAGEADRIRRTRKREDSSGVRVTGFGATRNRSNFSSDAPTPSAPPSDLGQPGRTRGRSYGQARDGKETTTEEQNRRNAAATGNAKNRRESNKLSVLRNVNMSNLDEIASKMDANMRRTYTPKSSHARRQDLRRRKDLKKTKITTPRAEYRVVEMTENIRVSDFAKALQVKAGEIIKKLMTQGMMVTMNDTIDFDTATLMASEYEFEVKNVEIKLEDILTNKNKPTDIKKVPRAPVVTVMGHVDHGKTSILDAVRKANIADGEAGGITQHIGAYSVEHNENKITFLDTPGHEAFSSMRARGAQVTDIVVLVVAADDGVMPQTVEAINHAKAAEVPIIVAVNKIDKGEKGLDRMFTQLMEHGIQSEEWGGDTQFVKVSALKNIGLDSLLEAILLQTEILDLEAEVGVPAESSVIEAHLDKGRGPVATLLVTSDELKIGDVIVAGMTSGRVRAMKDHKGTKIKSAGPSTPVEIVGLDSVPLAGDSVHVVENESKAKEIISWRREQKLKSEQTVTSDLTGMEALLGKIQESEMHTLPLIVKGDTQGSVEAVCEAIMKLNTEKISNKIAHKAVGGINESDMRLAQATDAVIIGFNVRVLRNLESEADKLGVPIKYYSIIYDVVDAVKSLMAGKLPPILKEVVQGHAEVRELISISRLGNVAGSSVTDGKIVRDSKLRLIRDNVVVFEGKLSSLRRFKEDVKEVASGYECGICIEGYKDVRIGDVVEAFTIVEEAATL